MIAATSRPELLDPALLRSGRIDRLVECPLPDAVARVRIFEALSSTLNLDECVDFDWFAGRTPNYTGADIQSILTSANMAAVKEALAQFGHEVSTACPPETDLGVGFGCLGPSFRSHRGTPLPTSAAKMHLTIFGVCYVPGIWIRIWYQYRIYAGPQIPKGRLQRFSVVFRYQSRNGYFLIDRRLLRMRTYCHYNRQYNGNIFFLHKLSLPANKQIIKNFNEPRQHV